MNAIQPIGGQESLYKLHNSLDLLFSSQALICYTWVTTPNSYKQNSMLRQIKQGSRWLMPLVHTSSEQSGISVISYQYISGEEMSTTLTS